MDRYFYKVAKKRANEQDCDEKRDEGEKHIEWVKRKVKVRPRGTRKKMKYTF